MALKATLAQMVNSILIPIIVARYIKNDIYSASGLVDNIFMMSFSIALVAPIVVFFDPVNYLAMLTRCWKRRLSKCLFTQEANYTKIKNSTILIMKAWSSKLDMNRFTLSTFSCLSVSTYLCSLFVLSQLYLASS